MAISVVLYEFGIALYENKNIAGSATKINSN